MKFSLFAPLLSLATMAMAQPPNHPHNNPPPNNPGLSSSWPATGASSFISYTPTSTTLPVTTAPYSGNDDGQPALPLGPPGPPGPPHGKVTNTVTDILTSTYCDKCDEVYTTVYSVTYTNVCPTGLTLPVYTITETCTGNSATFTPTTRPPSFTVYETVCTACENPSSTITITEPCATSTTTPAPAPPYTTGPPPKNKPVAGTTYAYPPAQTSGPVQVTVNTATSGSVQFFTIVVALMGCVFAGALML